MAAPDNDAALNQADVNKSAPVGSFVERGNPHWVPTGPPLEYFEGEQPVYPNWGNGGKKDEGGKGIARLDRTQAPKLLYDAPLVSTTGACCCGMFTNQAVAERSYIWIMENRMEVNNAQPVGMSKAEDSVSVQYYDTIPVLMPLTFCQKTLQCRADSDAPQTEWFDDSTLCCFIPCPSFRVCGAFS